MTCPLISSRTVGENYYVLFVCEGTQVWGVMRCGMFDFTRVSRGPTVSVFRVYFGNVLRTVTQQVLYLTSVRRETCPRHYETPRRARRIIYALDIFSVLPSDPFYSPSFLLPFCLIFLPMSSSNNTKISYVLTYLFTYSMVQSPS